MAAARGIKHIILFLYKGLIYWFFWASCISMRDEMFCSCTMMSAGDYTGYHPQASFLPITVQAAMPATVVCTLRHAFQNDLRWSAQNAHNAFESFIQHHIACLRALTTTAKEIPAHYRLHITLYSG